MKNLESFDSVWWLPSYLECDEGKFGLHCNQSCGHCLNNEQCHYINGTCFNGCDSGYYGRECKKGNVIKRVILKKKFNFHLNKMFEINKEWNLAWKNVWTSVKNECRLFIHQHIETSLIFFLFM